MKTFKRTEYHDLREEIALGKLSKFMGRIDEMDRLTRIANRSINNNVILVGLSGTGKTSLVYGWIEKMIKQDRYKHLGFVQLGNDGDLTPGMTGQASITKATHDNVVIVPRSALTGNFVYVINKGKVELRKIVPGFIGFDKVEIKEGLKLGEIVIVEDIFNFRNSQRVKTQKISG